MKLIVLLLDNSSGPWHEMYQKGALETWSKEQSDNFKTILYMGRKPHSKTLKNIQNRLLFSKSVYSMWGLIQTKLTSKDIKCEMKENVIKVDVSENWSNISLKTLSALRYVHDNFDYDYILRANASCYVNLDVVREMLSAARPRIDYCGPIAKEKQFVSGWAVVMSSVSVEAILNTESTDYLRFFDDEAIGLMLKKNNIFPTSIPFLQISTIDNLKEFSKDELTSKAFLRVKGFNGKDRIDHILMQKVHELIMN